MTADTYPTYFARPQRVSAVALGCMMLLLVAGCTSTQAPTREVNGVARPVTTSVADNTPAVPSPPVDTALIERLRQIAYTEGTLVARAQLQTEQELGIDHDALLLISATVDWLEGNTPRAKALLSQVVTNSNGLARDLAQQQQQHILELERRWLEAAEIAYQRSQTRASGQTTDLMESLWSLLMHVEEGQLQRAIGAGSDSEWRQWLSLNASYRQGRQAVITWLQQNPNHPGAQELPGALSTWLQTTPPSLVAVVLPLSGPLKSAGNAVLGGIIAELYQHYPLADTRPSLSTIDSNQFDNIADAYREAENQGAAIILGPLTKSNVQRLGTTTTKPVPVIALNRPEVLLPSEVTSWSALSLAPEDEARQLARIAFGEGLRRAVLITPNSDWGRRMTAALKETWHSLGGQVTTELAVDDDEPLSVQISQVVGSAQAEARVKAFEDAFTSPIEARPRRREDYDVIFLLTPSPAEARAIRPLLVFHYSGEVPVYAPSTIYAGDNPVQNRDLNSVQFLEIPAMLRAEDDLRFRRLNALGADAVRMLEHHQQALETRAPLFAGDTGLLQRAGNGDILRELDLVVFADDNVRRINLPSR